MFYRLSASSCNKKFTSTPHSFNDFLSSSVRLVSSFRRTRAFLIDMPYAWSTLWHWWNALLSSFPPGEASDPNSSPDITRVSDGEQGQHFHLCQREPLIAEETSRQASMKASRCKRTQRRSLSEQQMVITLPCGRWGAILKCWVLLTFLWKHSFCCSYWFHSSYSV